MSTSDNNFRRVEWTGDQWHESDDDGPDGMPLRPRGPGLSAEDLELLKLAARALGAVRIEEVEGEAWLNLYFADGSTAWNWNPLLHGDDTLNLSIDLNIEIRYHLAGNVPGVTATCASDSRVPVCREPWTPAATNKRTATRRAVTRAAAEIGKAMP
jgi:hypothetical protein